jgi:uncharacterized repeat protein (TIGR03803 family)
MKTYRPGALAPILALALSTAGAVSAPLTAQARTFTVLYSFTGSPDGGNPAGLTLGMAGTVYGATIAGGAPGCYIGAGYGTVFDLTLTPGSWSESVLYTFTGGADGDSPSSSVLLDAGGNLYGTAEGGGSEVCSLGCGVAFELSPGSGGWTQTVLYSFQGGTGGSHPSAALVFDKHGHLYSTLANGGTYGSGSVYELTNGAGGWKEKILHSFNGGEPAGAVILDAAGNLYGTTTSSDSGGGTVFELLHGSWKARILHKFTGLDGSTPEAGLVFDKAGNLYGTTEGGGKYSKGVVFKLAPGAKGKWKETVLHTFKGGSDGNNPLTTPVLDKAGNLYGTAPYGGSACNCGTVFKLTPGKGGRWKETVLHRFTGGSDGSVPDTGLIIDAAGNLYGTTFFGGNTGCYNNGGCGVVFEITP